MNTSSAPIRTNKAIPVPSFEFDPAKAAANLRFLGRMLEIRYICITMD
jgi:hypothetical protein